MESRWVPVTQRPGKVALLHPYWDFWEHTAPADFRSSRERLMTKVAAGLSDAAIEVSFVGLVDTEASSDSALIRRLQHFDAILVAQSMAVPPAFTLSAIPSDRPIPVLVWACVEERRLADEFDHTSITTNGATVGVPMLTSLLHRRARPHQVFVGSPHEAADLGNLRELCRLASIAGRLSRARLGRVGEPLPGYDHVDVDSGDLLEGLGITTEWVAPAEFQSRYADVTEADLEPLREELREWDLKEVAGDEILDRTLTAAVAVDRIVGEHRLDVGAFNCHVPEIRFSEEIGITPCYGLGRSTSRGVPWTCTGDALTAVAMLLAKLLSGCALYHELESFDGASDEFVIANSGEHDLAWCGSDVQPRLTPNAWFCDVDPICGLCAVFEPDPGPATLFGLVRAPSAPTGFRFVAARGELTSRHFPQTGTPNGSFCFNNGDAAEAWRRWVATGVNHHSAAAPGDHARAVEQVGAFTGVEVQVI